MYRHYIFTATSYTRHCRAAFDLVLTEGQFEQAKLVRKEIKKKNIHSVPTSLHVKEINSKSIDSLKKSDPYFEDVYFCQTLDEFMDYVQADLVLSSVDVGRYILSRIDATKLKLQKLIYLSYESYLKKTGKRLFADKIYAFQYGPVEEDFYRVTKGYSDVLLRSKLISDFDIHSAVQADCRMERAEDGLFKIKVIQDVLDKYGDLSPAELVKYTHREGTPWKKAYDGSSWKEISDDLIFNS